ncbi:MAG TPA: bifunctional pyr operon transcriptional regulator/uracil phosphoribosyltransferase PyrR [Chloroflexota bacterium]
MIAEERLVVPADQMRRMLVRMAHEIVEANGGTESLALVGICTRGVPLAQRLQSAIEDFEGISVPLGQLDITLYRDDLFSGRSLEVRRTELPMDINGTHLILVDDVLYTGRTVRAALDALMDYGRPRSIGLAVLVDRGHRELPIRPDHVGKNVPSAADEQVLVRVAEIDGRDEVVIASSAGFREEGKD